MYNLSIFIADMKPEKAHERSINLTPVLLLCKRALWLDLCCTVIMAKLWWVWGGCDILYITHIGWWTGIVWHLEIRERGVLELPHTWWSWIIIRHMNKITFSIGWQQITHAHLYAHVQSVRRPDPRPHGSLRNNSTFTPRIEALAWPGQCTVQA